MNVAKTTLTRIVFCLPACLLAPALPAAAQDDTAAPAEEAAIAVEVADSTPTSQMISEAPAELEEGEDPNAARYTWTLGAGGNIATGNTETWGVHAGTNFNMQKKAHEFNLAYVFNFGRAALGGASYATTAKNSDLKLRYNYWFTDNDAIYAGLGHRWDEFAGLEHRVRADLGYARKLWETDIHLLKGEVGLAYICDDRIATVTPQTQHNASLRAYLRYVGNPNENVQIITGLEFLDNINKLNEDPADIDPFKDIRINWDLGITAKLWEKLAASVNFTLKYDAEPVGTAENVDTQTVFSLIYTML